MLCGTLAPLALWSAPTFCPPPAALTPPRYHGDEAVCSPARTTSLTNCLPVLSRTVDGVIEVCVCAEICMCLYLRIVCVCALRCMCF